MSRRVVITGIGAISSIGVGAGEFWQGCLSGRSGGRSLDFAPWFREEAGLSTAIGAPVVDFDATRYDLTERELDLLDPVTRFALAGSHMALADAGLEVELIDPKRKLHVVKGVEPERFAAVLGTGIGGIATIEESHGHWVRSGMKKGCKRYWLPMLIPNSVPAQVAIRYQARAECKAVVTACASGTMAIGDAYRLIRDGEADVVLTGGAEATLSDPDGWGLMGFDLLRAMSTRNDDPQRASRPFERDRDGFVLSEGAGILFLEEREHAIERGARIYAEVGGYASNCDAYHIVMLDPSVRQITRLMETLLESTGTAREEVGYINAHGTSTQANDRAETVAIRRAFGDHADELLVSSTKSMTGHAVAGSGGLEAVATALALHHGIVPPTINLDTPDPECDLNYAPWDPVRREIRVAMTNSYGFGGHNGSLLLKRHEG